MYERTYKGRTEIVYEPEDFEEDLNRFTEILKHENLRPLLKQFDGVCGVSAGGIVLAGCLHYRLNLPFLLVPTKNSLVIDKIVNSGRKISHFIERGNFCASIFYNRKSIYVPNVWLREKSDNKWVRFALWQGMEDKGV